MDEHKQYMVSLGQHEALFDQSAGTQLRNVGGKIFLPDHIKRLSEEGYEDKEHMGVFWPDFVLERRNVKWDRADGKWHRGKFGIWRDDEHGTPSGTISSCKINTDKIVRERTRATNEGGAGRKDMNREWEASTAIAVGTVSSEVKKGEDGNADTLELSVKKRKLEQRDSEAVSVDSWGDGLLPGSAWEQPVAGDGGDEPAGKKIGR